MVSVGNLITANTEYRIFHIDGEVTEVYEDDETFKVKLESGEEEVFHNLDIVPNLADIDVDNTPADIPDEGPVGPQDVNLGGVLNKVYIHP